MMYARRIRAEPNEIDDFENAERIDDKECDEPLLLTVTCGVPESVSFDSDCPDCCEDDEGEYCEHECRRKWGV